MLRINRHNCDIIKEINKISLDLQNDIKRGKVDKLILEVKLDEDGKYVLTKESKNFFNLFNKMGCIK